MERLPLLEHSFGTLLTLAKVVAGVGWALVVFGVFSLLAGVGGGDSLEAGLGVAFGIAFVASGVLTVALGQLLRCVVSIERNTRVLAQLALERRDPGSPPAW